MKQKVFVVFDSKVEAYMTPFFCRSKGEALRSWETACNDGQSMMSKHPADYTLFESGEYDDATGRIQQHNALIPLGTAIEAKRVPQEQLPFDGPRAVSRPVSV